MIYKNKCVRTLILIVASFSLAQATEIEKKALFIPKRLGSISVHHNENGFSVEKDTELSPIQRCFMDKELRGISKDSLSKLIAVGAYLSVNTVGENKYSLQLNGRLNGGGVGGATFGAWFGKAAVSVIGHGAIAMVGIGVSAVATPAAGTATVYALESLFGASIELASFAGAIGCGILGGVATGPV